MNDDPHTDDDGPTDAELATVIAQLGRLDARLVALGHGRDPRSVRAAERFTAAWQRGAGRDGAPREVATTVSWPAEAASWLKPARRLGDADVDAWVVADDPGDPGDPGGWARMGERLRETAHWSPRRTLAFSGIDRAAGAAGAAGCGPGDLAAAGLIDGLAGADPAGRLWYVDDGRLVRHRPVDADGGDALLTRPAVELAPGAVHVPDWLSLERQRELVAACREWSRGPAPMRHTALPGGGVMSVQTVCLGWHWSPYRYTRTAVDQDDAPVTPFPGWLGELGRQAVADAYGDAAAGAAYDPDVALVNFYDGAARLGTHQDSDERSPAPIVSLSIGDTCVFRLGSPWSRGRPYQDVALHSGDLLVFGGPWRLAYHGVPKLLPGTAPPALGLDGGRLNLTLRETGL